MLEAFRSFLPQSARETARRARAKLLSRGLSRKTIFAQPKAEAEASEMFAVIVAICDAPEMLYRCLASVEKYGPRCEVILVDDGSKLPETLAIISDFAKRNGWIAIRSDCSTGHSDSCRIGAQSATRPYLCLLNSDTVLTPWSWLGARDAFEIEPTIGITGPTTSYASTPQMLRRAMFCRHYWTDAEIFAFAEQYVSTRRFRSWIDLPEVGGFAFFIRRNLWNSLGGFDPQLKDYGNESELCKRAMRCGHRIVWTQNSYIHHLGHQSYHRLGRDEIVRRGQYAIQYIKEKHG